MNHQGAGGGSRGGDRGRGRAREQTSPNLPGAFRFVSALISNCGILLPVWCLVPTLLL